MFQLGSVHGIMQLSHSKITKSEFRRAAVGDLEN